MTPERFWERTKWEGACLIWQGAKNKDGYGSINIGKGRWTSAHRYAFTLTHGDPGILNVLHTCDNPSCVNLYHLYAGTRKQNMRDRDSRARNGRSKLSLTQVQIIKTARDTMIQEFVERLEVDEETIKNILSGHSWGWV